ncbi:MAG: protein adenylyltransferase SelO family protein, partial [Acidithiobacillus sp.]
ILTRIAASHIRVGTFQFFAVRNAQEKVKQLADYTIARHYPELKSADNPYLALFAAVSAAQAKLIARWMLVGFIHGVMNTDNMSIAGETIDYGPCAFMDHYDPATVFSSIDAQGRYAYGNQPLIGQWNLTRLAETLIDLVHPDSEEAVRLLTEEIHQYAQHYTNHWQDGMRLKLGLTTPQENDLTLAQDFLGLLEGQSVDYTRAFRSLSAVVRGNPAALRSQFADAAVCDSWLDRWQTRLTQEDVSGTERAAAMDQVNPVYIPRNHKLEEALAAATQDRDLTLFKKLLAVVEAPFSERSGLESYAQPAPESFGNYQTFCGT